MTKIIITESAKALDKLKRDIAELMFESELFECQDQNGSFTDEVCDTIEDQVQIMFENTDKELAELELDIYYKTN